MIFIKLFNLQRHYKSGLYLDYYFKNILFKFHKNLTGNSFLYTVDKYMIERLIFSFNLFFILFSRYLNIIKSLNFFFIIKITLIIIIQLLLLLYL